MIEATDTTPLLWHFTFSHYAEKARWALDYKEVVHGRRALAPGLHYPRVFLRTGQPTVPVLLLGDGAFHDSTRIIAELERRWPQPPLYPADPEQRRLALELEEFFDEHLGHEVRRFMMHEGFGAPDQKAVIASMSKAFVHDMPSAVKRVFRASIPVLKPFLRWRYTINAATAERSRAKILAALDRIEQQMGGAGYLVGDAFSVADLTGAALLAPLTLPEQFPYPLPAAPAPGIDRLRESIRNRPGFAWALEVYRRHRGASAEVPLG